MTISHQSQLDYPLMPALLAEFSPSSLRETNRAACPQSGDAPPRVDETIVECLRKELLKIRKERGEMHLPPPPPGITLEDLDLDVRTFNCLAKLGAHQNLQVISSVRIRELLAIRNFGVRCLVDLLTALDAVSRDNSSGAVRSAPKPLTNPSRSGQGPTVLEIKDVKAISEHVRREGTIPHKMCARRFPKLPAAIRIRRFELKNRTYNCLERVGVVRDPHKLTGRTIGSILALQGFGKNSLVDLLDWLEPFISTVEGQPSWETITAHTLATEAKMLELTPSAETISSDDPRLGKLIRLIDPKAETLSQLVERLLTAARPTTSPSRLIEKTRRLRETINSLSTLTLETELRSVVAAWQAAKLIRRNGERDLEILSDRYGLAGDLPRTLQQVADTWGMTRERVRQICEPIALRLKDRRPFAPQLDRALALVINNPPTMALEIEDKLKAQGITQERFSLESLLSAAMLLGRDAPYSLESVGECKTIVAAQVLGSGNKILRLAKRSVEHWGAVTIEDVVFRSSEQSSFTADTVTRLIIGQSDFRWLDDTSGWFWLNSVPRNRLLNQIRKVFSVTDEIGVSELRAGVRRHHRMQGFAPPERVLLELCKQLPGFSVDGRNIKIHRDTNWRDLRSDTEKIMSNILRVHGSVMQREAFEERCIAEGVNRTTFYAYLNYSPVITKHAVGVYGLRGVMMYEDGNANQSLTDEEVLSIAGDKKRALLTANRRHFIQLHRRQPDHTGIVVCTFDPDFVGQAQRIADALREQITLEKQLIRIYRAA